MSSYSVEAILKATGASKFASDFRIASQSVGDFEKRHQSSFDKMRAVGGKMKSVGKTLTTAVTLPLVGIGAAVMSTGAKFSDQMSK